MNVGDNIKVFRKNAGLTQQELADILGMSLHTITKYEQNQREPNIKTLKRIASIFSISLGELLEYGEEPQHTFKQMTKTELLEMLKYLSDDAKLIIRGGQ
jgi:transcriptional regulator with XRE-family HTH domain